MLQNAKKKFRSTQILGILHNFLAFVFKTKVEKLCSMTKKRLIRGVKLFIVAKNHLA